VRLPEAFGFVLVTLHMDALVVEEVKPLLASV
jgi:hypothetical protein